MRIQAVSAWLIVATAAAAAADAGAAGAIATAAAASASAGTTSLLFAGTDFYSTAGCATVASFATVDPTGLDASARTDMATRDEVITGTIERGRTTAGRADATTREARLA